MLVEAASDGRTGLRRALDGTFDLIVLDVVLPATDGLDVCEALRRAGFDGAILMLTANRASPTAVRGLRPGADDYLGKPFDPSAPFLDDFPSFGAHTRRNSHLSFYSSSGASPSISPRGSTQGRRTSQPHRQGTATAQVPHRSSRRGASARTAASRGLAAAAVHYTPPGRYAHRVATTEAGEESPFASPHSDSQRRGLPLLSHNVTYRRHARSHPCGTRPWQMRPTRCGVRYPFRKQRRCW